MIRPSYSVPFPARGSIVSSREACALTELLNGNQTLSMGKWRTRFEEAFADLHGVPHAISVTSGTVAVELAIAVLGLRPGDQVITTPQTYHATVQPLLNYGVDVSFCDIEPDSSNISPERLESLITARTKAVLLVHYGGCIADMSAITRIAQRHGILVVEDCAHAVGATTADGRRPGSLGDIGCFSFQNSKNITTLGEGGMITCYDARIAERIRRIRDNEYDGDITIHPPTRHEPVLLPWMKYAEDVYRHTVTKVHRAGTNATMSEAAAAVGVVQLERLGVVTAQRQAIARQLDAVMCRYEFASPQRPRGGDTHAYHFYTFQLETPDPATRDELVLDLDRRGIEIQLRYFPQHLLPEWRAHGHGYGECPVAERNWFTSHVNLPCHPGLDAYQVEHLVTAVDAAFGAVSGATASSPFPQQRPQLSASIE